MALVTKDFSINITPGEMPPIVHVSEYDIGRAFNVTLIGENGSAFEIPTGTTVTVEGTLNGTVGFTTSATISNNRITFALTESMTAYAGKAWCKVKLVLNDEPIQTCAFILAVDRAGVEAETVIGASGFEQQIVDAVQDWLDEHPPAVGGMSEAFKQALLDCFENVAWINDDGQTYYDALYAALYPPVDVLSISAVFTQGEAVIYDTDDLDTLKQYLVVTATMTDSTTQTLEDTDYTLSGTLTAGTSTITVSYGGKTTTFNVTVTHNDGGLPSGYTSVSYITATQSGMTYTKAKQYINLGMNPDASKTYRIETDIMWNSAQPAENNGGHPYMLFGGGLIVGITSGKYMNFVAGTATAINASTSAFDSIVAEYNYSTGNCSYSVNGVTGSSTRTNPTTNRGAYLFGVMAADLDVDNIVNGCACSMKRTKIYENNVLIFDLIPCLRNSDSIAGMYDMVGESFYHSSGQQEFAYTA